VFPRLLISVVRGLYGWRFRSHEWLFRYNARGSNISYYSDRTLFDATRRQLHLSIYGVNKPLLFAFQHLPSNLAPRNSFGRRISCWSMNFLPANRLMFLLFIFLLNRVSILNPTSVVIEYTVPHQYSSCCPSILGLWNCSENFFK